MREVAQMLLAIGSVDVNLKIPFSFSSGLESPIYTDCRKLIAYPDEREKVTKLFAKTFWLNWEIEAENVDVIGGSETAGIPFAAFLANYLHMPMCYIRKEEKQYGAQKQIEGASVKNKNVLLVEDLISRGTALLRCKRAVEMAGGRIEHCLAVFEYGLPSAQKFYLKNNISVWPLTTGAELLEVGREKFFGAQEYEKIGHWLKNERLE